LSYELPDPGSGNLYILVLLESDPDQIVENRVVELLPPGRIGKVLRFVVFEAETLRDINGWALVVRTYGTPG
jgi:hypothetical protein